MKHKKVFAGVITAAMAFSLYGCSSEPTVTKTDTDPPMQVETGYTLTAQESLTVFVGQTASMRVDVTPSNYDGVIVYESDNPQVATVDDTGKITGVSAGECVVTATMKQGMDDASSVSSSDTEVSSKVLEGVFEEAEEDSSTASESMVPDSVASKEQDEPAVVKTTVTVLDAAAGGDSAPSEETEGKSEETSATGTADGDATGEEENSAAVTPAPTKKPAPTPAPAPAATPVPVPTCSTCGSTDHTVHPQPTPAPTPVPVPTCPTCGSTDHTVHPQPTPIPEDICGFCGGPRSVCGGIDYHHYHGNGSDVGDCPVCGFHYDINAGGGYVPPPSEADGPMPDDLA